MSQPVKLSDALVSDARRVGELTERSIAGQIEFWASLGRAIEPLLGLNETLALRRSGKAKPLSECLDMVETSEGARRISAHLSALPFPHYEAVPGERGLFIRIEEDGTRTRGRFVQRRFERA